MVTRARLRYTRGYSTPIICSLIKPAAVEKSMPFLAQMNTVMLSYVASQSPNRIEWLAEIKWSTVTWNAKFNNEFVSSQNMYRIKISNPCCYKQLCFMNKFPDRKCVNIARQATAHPWRARLCTLRLHYHNHHGLPWLHITWSSLTSRPDHTLFNHV